ncbi:MAG: hypothetical protein NTW68_11825 [candidate division NC10 bacterium]|nr:hypothetical protein [candidate division NC10 bacterium]
MKGDRGPQGYPPAVTTDKAHSRERFESLARSPAGWLMAAAELRMSADLVGDRFAEAVGNWLEGREPGRYLHVGAVFLMLAGFAIEALLKGIVLAGNPSTVSHGRLPKWLLNHDLSGLMQRANVPLTGDEDELLRRLVEAVQWRGRYPVPRHAGELPDSHSVGIPDVNAFRALYDRLERELSRTVGYVGGPLGNGGSYRPRSG